MFAGDSLQHVVAERAFVNCVGRRGEIQKQATSLPDNFRYGVAIVEAVGPEAFVVPAVFADGDAELFGVERET